MKAKALSCLFLCILFLTAALFVFPFVAEQSSYRDLKEGDSGQDVKDLKIAMYYLGYFTSLNVSDTYNSLTAERVRLLQKQNGLSQTGVADAALQTLVFSGRCVPANGAPAPTASPSPTPSPIPAQAAITAAYAASPTPFAQAADATPDPLKDFRVLKVGASGADVRNLKVAMYYLGYFTSLNVTESYNNVMEERVKRLQSDNGYPADGIATPALQYEILSGRIPPLPNAPAPSPVPTPSPKPLSPSNLPKDIPETNEKGFLTEQGRTYLYENPLDGLWLYKTNDLSITIARYSDPTRTLIWFETEIWCTPDTALSTYLSAGNTPGKRYMSPLTLASESKAMLAVTDDFFGHRLNNNYRTGIIIRNGKIIGDSTYRADQPAFPNLEVLAVFDDGRMQCFLSNAHTAEEYLSMGVVNTFAFGPILVQNGELGPHMTDMSYYHYREPRCAV
ncbi:MAG: peptidoglycan-binding protein, partial [Clostridia bacterium]|nr:peptidoglycan-binding protein [Clostridia bacterium]